MDEFDLVLVVLLACFFFGVAVSVLVKHWNFG